MKILLTNDDGIDSSGLKSLEKWLKKKHEILVVAPAEERSGFSNSLTFHKSITLRKFDDTHYSCSGTPADCVHRTLHKIINGFMPEIVVSGINLGPNLGTDIIYSGTAAAARQAAIMGVPGVAVSVTAFKAPFFFDNAAKFIAENIETFHKNWTPDHFININVPSIKLQEFKVMITEPSRRFYSEELEHLAGPDESLDISFRNIKVSHDNKKGTDNYAVEKNMISVCPVYLHPVSFEADRLLYKTVFKRKN